jgi:hypothetical protein
VVAHQRLYRARIDIQDLGHQFDPAVDFGQVTRRGNRFGQTLPTIVLGVQRLTLQIRFIDVVTIGEGQTRDAGARQNLGDYGSQGATPHQEYAAPPQSLLPGFSNGREKHLPGIPLDHAPTMQLRIYRSEPEIPKSNKS